MAAVSERAGELFDSYQTVVVVAAESTADAVYEQLRLSGRDCGKPGQAAVAGESLRSCAPLKQRASSSTR